jgi:RNA polymerase sigma factor (sigma-70 family)
MTKLSKHPKKVVSKDEFEVAYKNSDNQNIIKSVLKKYSRTLDYDTLLTCGLNALWRCLANHREEYGTKFTSSLYRFTKWECDREILKFKKNTSIKQVRVVSLGLPDVLDHSSPTTSSAQHSIFDDLESVLPQEHASIVRMKYVEDRTLKEIGEHFGYTKEAARQKLKVALKKLHEVYNDVWMG